MPRSSSITATCSRANPSAIARSTSAYWRSVERTFSRTARTGMLPIRMWGMMESTLDVRIAAIAGVLILATLVLVIVMDRLTGLTKRMSP